MRRALIVLRLAPAVGAAVLALARNAAAVPFGCRKRALGCSSPVHAHAHEQSAEHAIAEGARCSALPRRCGTWWSGV